MHIILSFLGVIVTILILLKRLADAGFTLGGLNPFLWHRRKQWQDQANGNPIFAIEDPMEVSALVLTGASKITGDMTAEQKTFLLSVFEKEFHQSGKESAGLLASSSYLLGDGQALKNELEKVLKPSLEKFSQTQAASVTDILDRLSQLEGNDNELLVEFTEKFKQIMDEKFKEKETWD
jgi:hypothetical protein